MTNLICPDCGADMTLKDSKYGLFYGCSTFPDCRSAHGAHPDGKPLGIPAKADVKKARIEAHDAFDLIWQGGYLTRKATYIWLRKTLGMSSEDCHIGRFDKAECARVIEEAEKYLKSHQG